MLSGELIAKQQVTGLVIWSSETKQGSLSGRLSRGSPPEKFEDRPPTHPFPPIPPLNPRLGLLFIKPSWQGSSKLPVFRYSCVPERPFTKEVIDEQWVVA